MSLVTRKPDFVAGEQQKLKLVNASAQSDQCLCYLFTCYMQNFIILAYLCSRAYWFDSHLIGNFEDKLFQDKFKLSDVVFIMLIDIKCQHLLAF